jgi:hypothetical protein
MKKDGVLFVCVCLYKFLVSWWGLTYTHTLSLFLSFSPVVCGCKKRGMADAMLPMRVHVDQERIPAAALSTSSAGQSGEYSFLMTNVALSDAGMPPVAPVAADVPSGGLCCWAGQTFFHFNGIGKKKC